MNEKDIRAKFTPKVCNSQIEFDAFIHEVNNEQSILNAPYNDRIRELNQRKALIDSQKKMLNAQLETIKVERLSIEQEQKNINRVFHAIKHELMELNPKGLKNEAADS